MSTKEINGATLSIFAARKFWLRHWTRLKRMRHGKKINYFEVIFENKDRKFSIRELSRILKINHTAVKQYLNKLVKEKFLSSKKEGEDYFYKLTLNKKPYKPIISYLNIYFLDNWEVVGA